MNRFFAPVLAAVSMLAAGAASAAVVEFVPPSDPVGHVYSTSANDGYDEGRGVLFAPTSDFILSNVGILQDFTHTDISYSLRLATGSSGYVGGGALLRSGTQTVGTGGLQFVYFGLPAITLNAGTYYLLEFSFTGPSNQNFFFNQTHDPVFPDPTPRAESYSQPGFTGINGTQAGDTSNTVLADIRLNSAPAPEPESWALMIIGFGAIGMTARGNRRRTA